LTAKVHTPTVERLLAARARLLQAETAQAHGRLEEAIARAREGITELGSTYARPEVIDDTSLKLAAAEDQQQKGRLESAASVTIDMLRVRLSLYTDRYPDAPKDPRALALRLAAPRPSSGVGEPMQVELTLASTGTAPVVVNSRLALNTVHAPRPFREVVFEMRGPGGALLPFLSKVRIGKPEPQHVTELAPGQSLERRYDLAPHFDLEAPGSYAVRAFYSSAPVADTLGRPAFSPQIASEWIPFERQ